MNALRLAFALIRVPRLFASLLLIPLILGLVLVYLQLVVTGIFIRAAGPEGGRKGKTVESVRDQNLGRKILYGSGSKVAPIKVCRWIWKTVDGVSKVEIPPTKECQPDRLDVAIRVHSPATFDVAEYERIFDGNVERLHICETCHPDVVIDRRGKHPRADVYSTFGLLVLSLASYNEELVTRHIETVQNMEDVKNAIGKLYLHTPGFQRAAPLSGSKISTAIVFNIAALVVITLWLALKAHRKVLDYFARSGALLPMVAATGRTSFYSAIWILTGLRVMAFLYASVPMMYYGVNQMLKSGRGASQAHFFRNDVPGFTLWLLAIVCSMSLATLIASIADLKQRHHLMSFIYRYIPIIICALGGLIWAVTFLFEGQFSALIRNVVSAIPLLGVTPVLVAPIFQPLNEVLVMHMLLTLFLLTMLLRYNAQWFAAHLEEL